MAMPIALFTTGLAGGGAERVVLTLAEGIAELGYPVDLVVTKARGPLVHEVPQSVRLVDLCAPRILASMPGLVRYLRRERPHAMLSALAPANCVAVWATRFSRVPMRLVLSEHSTLSISSAEASSWRKRIMPWIMRPTYRRSDAVVAVSQGVADDLSETIGLPPDRIKVIHNPVVTPRMLEMSNTPLEQSWFEKGTPVILGAGRLTRAKDFPTLVRAFAQVRRQRRARLMILGEGEQRETLKGLVSELDLTEDVSLPGFVSNPYAYMRRADVFVLSSRWEGFGNVLVEAMACGTPVVSTDCPSGPSEILEEGAWGELTPVADPNKMAAAILRTLDGPRRDVEARARAFSAVQIIEYYLRELCREDKSDK